MARITQIEDGIVPKIDGFVIYPLDGQLIIRAQSGFTKKGLKNNPKYANCKKNASEFGRVSSVGKHIRLALQDFLPRKNNLAVVNALTKKLRVVLQCDTISARGERLLSCAFATSEALEMIKGYAFNPDGIGYANCKKDVKAIELTFETLTIPDMASYLALQTIEFGFNFQSMAHQLSYSDLRFFSLQNKLETIRLPREQRSVFEGTSFLLVAMVFYKKVGDSFVALSEDGMNQLVIL